jgi:hypothetical protein
LWPSKIIGTSSVLSWFQNMPTWRESGFEMLSNRNELCLIQMRFYTRPSGLFAIRELTSFHHAAATEMGIEF